MNKYFVVLVIVFCACSSKSDSFESIDIQGHRGARGLAPENSLPAFIMAADLGVSTLELDLVVSKDQKLVVSHEPFFSPDFCLDTLGNTITQDSIINMYHLDYDQITHFDCGSTRNSRFPDQKTIPVFKPLFSEVIDSVESFIRNRDLKPIFYNVELKTQEATDNVFHPEPSAFSELVYEMILEKKIKDRVIIQSFDFRTLQYFKEKYPEIKLALLIENELPWQMNVDSLGFIPEIYSSYYKLLSQQEVKKLQKEGMKVIPWTVNDSSDIMKVIAWGVDGVITDYPDRVLDIIKRK
ncbi:MAG: glycerophosphodiester phosphodiesterase family protein [Bacteroidota bacterium]